MKASEIATWMVVVPALSVLVVAGIIGWVLNIVALGNGGANIGMLILRGIGVLVVPIGAVLGYV